MRIAAVQGVLLLAASSVSAYNVPHGETHKICSRDVKGQKEQEVVHSLETRGGLVGRRRIFRHGVIALGASFFGASPLLGGGQGAWAAAPITLGEAQNVGAQAKRMLRPKPPKILRPRIERDFAVLLMRSSYNVLDELDCVAMDQFQRDFFIIRQAEYETYANQLGPGLVSQGDLSDPYYFDFISFAQYTTISREMTQDAPLVFSEKQPIEVEVPEGESQKFTDTVVRRDPRITNSLLPVEHSKRVGSLVLDRLNEIFDDTPIAIPKYTSRPDAVQLVAAMQQLVKIFVLNGYAFDGIVSVEKTNPLQLSLSLTSPATLWSGQALLKERSAVSNSFLLKTASVLAERYGFFVSDTNVKYDGTREINYLTLR